jgi:hypothetical protein
VVAKDSVKVMAKDSVNAKDAIKAILVGRDAPLAYRSPRATYDFYKPGGICRRRRRIVAIVLLPGTGRCVRTVCTETTVQEEDDDDDVDTFTAETPDYWWVFHAPYNKNGAKVIRSTLLTRRQYQQRCLQQQQRRREEKPPPEDDEKMYGSGAIATL